MRRRTLSIYYLIMLFALFSFAAETSAMPPSKAAIQQWIAEGVLQQKIQNWQNFKLNGGSAPWEHSPLLGRESISSALAANTVDTLRLAVILVEFSDWPASGQDYDAQPYEFDSLLFSDRQTQPGYNPTGSMTDFYMENSYGTLFIQGDIYGWYMMPKTYAYYVGTDDGLTRGAELAGDAVDAAEADGVNWVPYANGDIYVDGVVVVHAGPGAEEGGAYGIWSHHSNMSLRIYDGVRIQSYTLNPEEISSGLITMGVFDHEYGHVLGLPDLYDINDASTGEGLGDWSLMAGGSWNDNGRTPAKFDAWCRSELGFANITWLSANLDSVTIPQVLDSPVIYGLGENPGSGSTEYWLVENRQRNGFDAALPGGGMLIYHVDESVFAQNNPNHYHVALEQADGRNDLSVNGNSDGGDPWPGSKNNRNFHDQSNPNSRDYDGSPTEVGVWQISNSGPVMYADLDVTFSRPWPVMATADSVRLADSTGGDGDGIFEAGETIDLYVKVINRERTAYGPVASLSCDIPGLTVVQNDVPMDGDLTLNTPVGMSTPIRFTLAPDFESIIGDLTITITSDSISGSGDGTWTTDFPITEELGAPQILIVDDDDGATWETRYETAFLHLRKPSDYYDKSTGSPTGAQLLGYKTVVWYMGSNIGPGGTLTSGDVAAMKQFLDGGGNLFLTSMTGASQLQTLDSAFMANYLHANYAADGIFALAAVGDPGSDLGDGMRMTYDGNAPINPLHEALTPTGNAEAAFHLADDYGNGDYGTCGVTYTGDYRTFFYTLPFEFMTDAQIVNGFMPKDSIMKHVLDFFERSYPYVRYIDAEGDDFAAMVNHTPTFAWNVKDTGLVAQTEYELEVGSDNDWTTAEMWSSGVVASGDTSATYGGAPLIDGTTYYIRLRTGNGTYWSDWFQTSFHMNSLPIAPLPVSPDGNQYTTTQPELVLDNGSDAEGSALSYQFEVATDDAFTTVVATSPNVSETSGTTSWTVSAPLSDFTQHWWRARTYDGAEYSDWSAAATFTVNSAYQAPTGSLQLASSTVYPVDTGCVVQTVELLASKPLTSGVVPLKIPAGVTICGVSFDGYPAASWDQNDVLIDEGNGYMVVTLANSFGDKIPAPGGPAFDILFSALRPCPNDEPIVWDTARYDVPAEQLQYTDTMETFSPAFALGQDTTFVAAYMPGNIDNEGTVDIGDLTALIGYLFIQGDPPIIQNSSDVNADCVGPDIGDLTYLIGYLFIQGSDPVCGCANGGSPAPRVSGGVIVQTRSEDGRTIISLNSPVDLRGVQLDLASAGIVNAEPIGKTNLDLLSGQQASHSRLALLDLDGPAVIPAGKHDLIAVDGPIDIESALVSDLNNAVLVASINGSGSLALPAAYNLSQNYPNPFNPTTMINFALPEAANVSLDVYNVLGQKVATVLDGRIDAGYHSVEWNGRNDDGTQAASGVYLYRLSANNFVESRKMVLLK